MTCVYIYHIIAHMYKGQVETCEVSSQCNLITLTLTLTNILTVWLGAGRFTPRSFHTHSGAVVSHPIFFSDQIFYSPYK